MNHFSLHHCQGALPFHFPANYLHRFPDENGRTEPGLHLSRVCGDTGLQEQVVPHDLIHERHNKPSMHAVIVALVLVGRGEKGKAAVRSFKEVQMKADGILLPAGKAHAILRTPMDFLQPVPHLFLLPLEELFFFIIHRKQFALYHGILLGNEMVVVT